MPEVFLELSQQDQYDALGVAAETLSRPPDLLEKDLWVVWALQTLGTSTESMNLVFKGGTSLSKAYKIINRFSEDIDVTFDIRVLAGDLVESKTSLLPSSKSQAGKWDKELRKRLDNWISGSLLEHFQTQSNAQGLDLTYECTPKQELFVIYNPLHTGTGYVKPVVKLEFGAKSTGEPYEETLIECDTLIALPDLVYPSATPLVMSAERTFWEKLTAVHVACLQKRFRGTSRFSRHWYDLVRLDATGIASRALLNHELANQVAGHKAAFFHEKADDGTKIDYRSAVSSRQIQIVPQSDFLDSLHTDFDKMIEARLIEDDTTLDFDALIGACRNLEASVIASAE